MPAPLDHRELAHHLADALCVDPDELATSDSLLDLGLDSLHRTILLLELESLVGDGLALDDVAACTTYESLHALYLRHHQEVGA